MSESKPSNPKDLVGIRKVPMSVVPQGVLAELGLAMMEGALKYGRHNYRAVGVRASVYYDAMMRHMMRWWEGEDNDPDSGVCHLIKAMACLVVLRDSMQADNWEDDRPPSIMWPPDWKALDDGAAALKDQYANREVKHYTQENIDDGSAKG